MNYLYFLFTFLALCLGGLTLLTWRRCKPHHAPPLRPAPSRKLLRRLQSRWSNLRRAWRRGAYLAPLALHAVLAWLRSLFMRIALCFRLTSGFRPPTSAPQFANIGEGTYENGHKSYLPDATTTSRYLLYKRGTDADHCAVCGAGDDPLGASDDQADATDVPIAIKLFGAIRGTTRVVTDGTLADGDYCKAGASGKVTKATTGDLAFGRALISTDSSSANLDVITIIPVLPSKLSF